MSKPNILISVATHADTATTEFGRTFIEILCGEDARLVPEMLSETDNYKEPFRGVEDFLSNWWAIPEEVRVDGRFSREAIRGLSWKRKSALASRGYVFHGFVNKKNIKIQSKIWFEAHWAKDVSFNHIFEAWVRLSRPEIAMLHVFVESERILLGQTEEGSWFESGSFGGPAKPGLPNIGWAMAYGGDYAVEVDIASIKGAGFPVSEIDGTIIVRVTENLSDVVNNFSYFSRRRAELKKLFRPGLFWIDVEPLAA